MPFCIQEPIIQIQLRSTVKNWTKFTDWMIKSILKKINKPIWKHSLFWIVVYLFYTTSARERFATTEEVLVTYAVHVLLQITLAYGIIWLILPVLKKRGYLSAILRTVLLLFLVHFLYVNGRIFFLEPLYPDCYRLYFELNGAQSYAQRVFDLRGIFLHRPLFYLQPLFFLIALQFYEKQYDLSKIAEQKKSTELKLLKHQLNPHFLFNTLNNLYALASAKSDKTPELIKRLSDMLDYMLYSSDSNYVSIKHEVDLIENYLALEQIRYEDRVEVVFVNNVIKDVKIAPLILLTFIENAFKHGVSQATDMAKIDIRLSIEDDDICFIISNTKPSVKPKVGSEKKNIGISNVEQQLDILYPSQHSLEVQDTEHYYKVVLKLELK